MNRFSDLRKRWDMLGLVPWRVIHSCIWSVSCHGWLIASLCVTKRKSWKNEFMGCGVQRCDILVDSPANSEPTNFKNKTTPPRAPQPKHESFTARILVPFSRKGAMFCFISPIPNPNTSHNLRKKKQRYRCKCTKDAVRHPRWVPKLLDSPPISAVPERTQKKKPRGEKSKSKFSKFSLQKVCI